MKKCCILVKNSSSKGKVELGMSSMIHAFDAEILDRVKLLKLRMRGYGGRRKRDYIVLNCGDNKVRHVGSE